MAYDNEIRVLLDKINVLQQGDQQQLHEFFKRRNVGKAGITLFNLDDMKARKQQINVLQEQLIVLQQAREKCKQDWILKQKGLNYDFAYAVGLLAAFIIACTFLTLPGVLLPTTAMIIGLTGAALCFVLNGIYSAFTSSLDIDKSHLTDSMARAARDDYIALFLDSEEGGRERKRLYLEIKRLEATSDHQRKLLHFQEMALVHSIVVDAFIPAGMFAALVFLPFGFALAALAGGILVAYLAYKLIETYKPKEEPLPKFDQAAFEVFEREAVQEAKERPRPRLQAPRGGLLDKKRNSFDEDGEYDPLLGGHKPDYV